MAHGSEKATKAKAARDKTVSPKGRAGGEGKSSKKSAVEARKGDAAKASKAARPSQAAAKQATGAKPRAGSAPHKKTVEKPAASKETGEAGKHHKAPGPAQAKQAAAPVKPMGEKKRPERPAREAAPEDRGPKVVAARPVPPPAAPVLDRQAEQAAKTERQVEQRQAEYYEKAVALFNERKFSRALPLLEKAEEGPNVALRHRAHVYAEICRQQINSEKVQLDTAEDYYNYGVKLMNDRKLEEAERHLQRALRLAPKAGHIHYANAVLSALKGAADSAFGHLKQAIEIDPLNRVLALNDADLAGVMGYPAIAHLLREAGES
jgi:tetratricopeptide (TPR) repeat protein